MRRSFALCLSDTVGYWLTVIGLEPQTVKGVWNVLRITNLHVGYCHLDVPHKVYELNSLDHVWSHLVYHSEYISVIVSVFAFSSLQYYRQCIFLNGADYSLLGTYYTIPPVTTPA